MSNGQEKKRFCTYCGNSVGLKAVFCGECGENIGVKQQASVKPAASESGVKKAEVKKQPESARVEKKQINTQQIVNIGTKAAAVAQSLQAVPWKLVVGDQLPENPFPELVKAAGTVGVKLAGSLGGPAFSLFLATLIEASAAWHTLNPLATRDIYLKLVLSILILVLGIIAKNKKGLVSKLVMISTVLLSLIQANTLIGALQILISNPSLFAQYLPNGLTQAIAFTTAINTFRKSLR
jgi:hypothetical protein